MGDRLGRKRLLVAGWLFGLPVPLLIIWAQSWSWIILVNVLLGINQGLGWSDTVIMKIDLVGPKQRGLAMSLNEFAGYGAVSLLNDGMVWGLLPLFLTGAGLSVERIGPRLSHSIGRHRRYQRHESRIPPKAAIESRKSTP